jgi:preprotein translocase subunit SecG
MKKMIYILSLIFVVVIIVYNVKSSKYNTSNNEFYKKIVLDFYYKEFDGVIKRKYIDENEHNYKKNNIENR